MRQGWLALQARELVLELLHVGEAGRPRRSRAYATASISFSRRRRSSPIWVLRTSCRRFRSPPSMSRTATSSEAVETWRLWQARWSPWRSFSRSNGWRSPDS